MTASASRTVQYGRYLLFISGLGGLLYGIDVGIIAAALLYLGKTVSLSLQQTSVLVAAVLGGGMCSSLVAGVLADWVGRKRMMILSGAIFVASVGLIVASHGFVPLLMGRLLQGISGGFIAVVVPLYLAESLGADVRGRGTAIFQFMLTFGIVIAALTGFYFTHQAEAAVLAAAGDPVLIRAAQDHAWRGMFLSVVYPGILFFGGSFFLSETPRWLFRKGRTAEALASLRRSTSEVQAQLQMREMEASAHQGETQTTGPHRPAGSLLERKYVYPFVLACVILSFNQTTGINSVLGYLVIILKQAGMTASHATQGDVAVKVLNCVMTLVGVAFVDKKGRKFLLKTGTGGIVLALLLGAGLFYRFEAARTDVASKVRSSITESGVALPVSLLGAGTDGPPRAAAVVYDAGEGDRVATVRSDDADPTLKIAALPGKLLTIKQATLGSVPSEQTGWLITGCLGLFIASYAFGPGVVVWLMLSELMPTRIRSMGMGIALLLNQGVSTLIAAVFLPTVGRYGYYAMFLFWAICTALYFLTAAIFLPETKGRTLEEIETFFERRKGLAEVRS